MTNKKLLLILGTVINCFGCSTSIPEADLTIVDAEKNQLIQQWANTPESEKSRSFNFYKIMKSEYGHIQPLNKKESCKIPYLKYPGFVDEKHNFFWDGECSNGYAKGLGRIIVKSSYDHIEYIIDLSPDGVIPSRNYQWFRDYVHNYTEYGLDYANGESEVAVETISNENQSLNIHQSLRATYSNGLYMTENKISSDGESSIISYSNPLYQYAKFIITDPTRDVNFGLVTFSGGRDIGVSKVVFKNGMTATYIGDIKNQVRVPENYFNNMLNELNKAQEYSSKAGKMARIAKNMFDTYLYKACNSGGNKTHGIDLNLYNQICVYESQRNEIASQLAKRAESEQRNRMEQINQQRIIRAREAEAAAAQEQATAIQQLNYNLNRPRSTTCLNMGFGIVNCSSR